MNTKKFLFTFLDVIILVTACYWCFWLVFYFSATIDGAILINNAYALFERNYLVPAQSFGIPVIFTVLSVFFYRKMREKKLIGKSISYLYCLI